MYIKSQNHDKSKATLIYPQLLIKQCIQKKRKKMMLTNQNEFQVISPYLFQLQSKKYDYI